MKQRFCLENLFSGGLVPPRNMTKIDILNCVTRLIIVVAVIMALIKVSLWWLFLIAGICLVIGLYIFWVDRVPTPKKVEKTRSRHEDATKWKVVSR